MMFFTPALYCKSIFFGVMRCHAVSLLLRLGYNLKEISVSPKILEIAKEKILITNVYYQ
ncbi:hypothetical protein A35E_00547 [secondary endosymbiont of Heteropsylla cubana]|uniref:Uncharacterized protein n=1 Tax=secondary endosymbiont of Heteropsylla cubana TaxID=134287 RepID=J3VUI8_9ENTR|nr:hypothetical protein [secondary endosymbiont of Heteropsylla cubana]AFP85836.1 hypothetical protein A35E_00547 [secondary endosymbiont of Heteropsylla cubana]